MSLVVFGAICIPQYYSVVRRSLPAARAVLKLCAAGAMIAGTTAIAYPIVEHRLDFSPPGFELLGAVFYSLVALLFLANGLLHKRWIETISNQD